MSTLPAILAGPIPRRCTSSQLVFWLVTSGGDDISLTVSRAGNPAPLYHAQLEDTAHQRIQVGTRAFIHLLDVRGAFPEDELLEYDIGLQRPQGTLWLADTLPDLSYASCARPNLVICSRIHRMYHGSCRKPHHDSGDALLRLDDSLREAADKPSARPALLLLSGDQIYADDVAGPMLVAIHQVIAALGLQEESWTGTSVAHSQALYASELTLYRRDELLPRTEATRALRKRFFGGARKPIFTTASARNHLITAAEVIAMYLLVWSPQLWSLIDASIAGADRYGHTLRRQDRDTYRREWSIIERFQSGLGQVQRALAHVPVYMIFDDHDVSDDWNLSRAWEDAAYAHPFSRRIIGNALIGYWLCQGWGNEPQHFDHALLGAVEAAFRDADSTPQAALIDRLIDFDRWHYTLPTQPKLVVLDTRTHRWANTERRSRPSGLMDWESLSSLQQELLGEHSVILVSPAPIFGVKLIEVVQRLFTLLGYPLLVDAEYWMAHRGAAQAMLQMFLHQATPQHFVILSGDVHYSVVYDVDIRRDSRRHGLHNPSIWQITCSGLKNEFPPTLLRLFDRLDRWLYDSRSPLNRFTKRRRLRIVPRRPSHLAHSRLVNASAIGELDLDGQGAPQRIRLLCADHGSVEFPCAQTPDQH